MDSKKVLEIVGVGLTILGYGISIVAGRIGGKLNTIKMQEMITEEVAKQMANNKSSN